MNFCIEWLFTRALTLAGEKSKFEDDDITTDRTAPTATLTAILTATLKAATKKATTMIS